MDEELRLALSKKEKVQLFLSNLEKLKDEGSLDDVQYQDLKTEYNVILNEQQEAVKSIKARLRKEFDSKAEELEATQKDQELVQIRYNVREIRPEVYWAQIKPLRKKVEQLRKEVPKLRTLVNAKSTDELGGPAKVNLKELKLKKPLLNLKKRGKPAAPPPPTKKSEVALSEAGKTEETPSPQLSPSKDSVLVSKLVKEQIQPPVYRENGLSTSGKTYAGEKPAEEKLVEEKPAEEKPTEKKPAEEKPDEVKKEVEHKVAKVGRTPARTSTIVVIGAVLIVILVFVIGRAFSTPADNKPPAISGFIVSNVTTSSATIEWTTDEKATSQIVLRDPAGASVITEPDKNLVTKHAVTVKSIKPGIKYHVTVKSSDASGNEAVYDTDQTFMSGAQSGALPAISNVSVKDIGDTSAVITWQTDKPATSQAMVSEVGTVTPLLTTPGVDLKTSHTVTVTNLKPNATYSFSVLSKDASGNQAIYDTGKTFTTITASPVGIEVGKRAPDFTLPAPNGQNLTLSSFRGKVVMLNFWQRTCPACVREMPMMQSVFTHLPADKVIILGVNVSEDEETVRSFKDRWNLTFPIVLDAKRVVADNYKVSTIPETLFLDTQGIIKEIVVGPLNSIEEIETKISALLK
jgi:cytochrome c biogenesis protein CcmG/thiol:disulfide interchange protein DsbE